ncbi:F-box/FBD/LRR-repeat protein [Thalictrum thalictroides]|uniref:F-box/FBD/LRR-repeat protein n=1 Tax=Thalictrum thalictroides TaxID=46969 RepID=A0A7J6VGQ8_THATH|nr:F-box/FBD/LRR-repeat protein [Thalictrum thalictroides]
MAVSLPRNKKKIDYGCLDRLSNLPKEVINEILERMPINDAVKTSMLSRSWRYRWMSISKLIFNSHSISFSNERGRTNADLVNYVTNILLLHNGMISKFEVNNFLESGCSDVDRWILVLSRTMLKDLVLVFHEPNSYLVPACLFVCENLSKLMLKGCKLRLPSQYEGFSHLTHIDLQDVDATVVTIEKLVEMSPLLLSLKVWSCCYLDQCLTVHAPNLIHCTINGRGKHIRFRNAPKLESAYINIWKVKEHFFHRATCKLDEVLHGVDRIRVIDIYHPFMDVNLFDEKVNSIISLTF